MNAELYFKRPNGKEDQVAHYVPGNVIKNRMPGLVIESEWEHILDSIIISFIIIEKMKRDRRVGVIVAAGASS